MTATEPAGADEEQYAGYAVPAGTYLAPEIKHTRFTRTIGVWTAGIVVVAAALIGVSMMLTKKAPRFMCPPECGRPPTGIPVMALPRYTAPDGSF